MLARIWLLVAVAVGCAVCLEWVKLNSIPVCYGAKESLYGEFVLNGSYEAHGIKLVRRSGHHDCDYYSGGYFGCEVYMWGYFETTSPIKTFANISQDSPMADERRSHKGLKAYMTDYREEFKNAQADTHGHRSRRMINPFDPQPGSPGPQFMHLVYAFLTDDQDMIIAPSLLDMTQTGYLLPSVLRPAWDNSIIMPPSGQPITFENGEVLRLWHGEDLQNRNETDNFGTLCADVYAEIDSPPVIDPECACQTRECLIAELANPANCCCS